MILLLAGTGETAGLASGLAEAGLEVLVSTATDLPLELGDHPRVRRRSGPLDDETLDRLCVENGISVVVDATHPYAAVISETARRSAERTGLPYLRWLRPASVTQDDSVITLPDHQSAADAAFSFGRPVLLTIGSRNVAPYAARSHATGISLAARVLDDESSVRACLDAGIPRPNIIASRGPFSLEDNIQTIRRFKIGVIVTKDGGVAGGAPEKLEAARVEHCRLIVIQRPDQSDGPTYSDPAELISAVCLAARSASDCPE